MPTEFRGETTYVTASDWIAKPFPAYDPQVFHVRSPGFRRFSKPVARPIIPRSSPRKPLQTLHHPRLPSANNLAPPPAPPLHPLPQVFHNPATGDPHHARRRPTSSQA